MGHFIKKSKTNQGELAKQYFKVVSGIGYDTALVIKKLVLSSDYGLYCPDFKILKTWKDKYLFEKWFSIKLSTLRDVVIWLNK